MKGLKKIDVPSKLLRMVARYFTVRVLKNDTKSDTKEFHITGHGLVQVPLVKPIVRWATEAWNSKRSKVSGVR